MKTDKEKLQTKTGNIKLQKEFQSLGSFLSLSYCMKTDKEKLQTFVRSGTYLAAGNLMKAIPMQSVQSVVCSCEMLFGLNEERQLTSTYPPLLSCDHNVYKVCILI